MYSPVHPSRLYEQMVDQIESRILVGDLNPGDRLPSERELGQQFEVSRTVVREAIKALREKGLVDIQPGRGTFVTGGTSAAIRHSFQQIVRANQGVDQADLVQVRAILEPEIAAIAARMADDNDIAILQASYSAMDQHLDNALAFIEYDHQFHIRLAEATHNALIPILLDPMVELLLAQRSRIFLVEGGPQRGQSHHRNILDAIIAHEPAAAREAMQAHMEQIRRDSGADR